MTLTRPGGSSTSDQVRVITAALPGDEIDPVLLRDAFDCERDGIPFAVWSDFLLWTVETGFAELDGIGAGSADLEVDLDGQGTGPARLASNAPFALVPGDYVLEYDVVNTGSGAAANNQMAVTLGSVYGETFALLAGQTLPRIERRIAVSAPESAILRFDHSGIPDDGSGLRIDNVLLWRASEYARPPGDFSTLTSEADGSFTRTRKDATRITFDAAGLQRSVTDRFGNETEFDYDPQGRLTTITDPVGRTTSFSYAFPMMVVIEDPAGRTSELMLDGANNLESVVLADGLPEQAEHRFAYDADHRMLSEIGPRGYH
ncbi:MAG: hypothetical protein L0206_06625, partial [Actinobacteria bacterium]|nr:hypothetical protein [Actinomycetota bacterium]